MKTFMTAYGRREQYNVAGMLADAMRVPPEKILDAVLYFFSDYDHRVEAARSIAKAAMRHEIVLTEDTLQAVMDRAFFSSDESIAHAQKTALNDVSFSMIFRYAAGVH